MSPKVKQVLRYLVAVIVVIGLGLATHKAISQWQLQQQAAEERIAEIQRQIDAAAPARIIELKSELATARQLVPSIWNLDWKWIAAAALLYLIGLVPGGMVLHEGVRMLGYPISRRTAIGAQVVGHLGKYVPGKAMVVVIRAARLNQSGVPALSGSVAVFLETLLMMAVGAALAGCLIFWLPAPGWIAWSAFLGGLLVMVPTLPPVLGRVAKRLSKRATNRDSSSAKGTESSDRLNALANDWRYFVSAWFWQLAAWGLIGGAFYCLVISLPGHSTGHSWDVLLIACIASMALAMVVGFVSLLPGGAGVRELTLAVVLAPIAGASQALLAAIMARLLFIAVEMSGVALVRYLPVFSDDQTSGPADNSSGN